ncbi:hypothetical protein JMJ35_004000 [Cladonia borealis]|uniref:Peptidase C14 caspase domain-containing protein n=1 Tax=Cladonia borealis TaxID=184061 RepID=A0AA39R547_9LECA|nr:hypothetical protein JMJ35_004000 [Cladonia borealis]
METPSQTPPPKGPKDRKAQYERARVTFDKTISGHYRDGKTGYKDVGVLFITWEEDDLQCKETEVDALNDLFTNEFKYSTDYYQIPSEKWQTGLMRKVSDFMWQYDSPDCLAIIYYGGHGYEGRETKKFKLAAKFEADENGDPTVFFNDIRNCARLPACDQLMIIDCCFAAKAFARESIGKRKFELLTSAAANEESVAPHFPGSFTSNLNKVLRRLLVDHPNGFSTTHLYRELYHAELKTKPQLFDQSRYSFGRIWLRPQIPAPEPREKGKSTLLELTLRLNGEPHGAVMNELATHLQYLPHTEEVRIENLHAPIDQLENFMLFVLRAQKLRPLVRRLCARRQFQKVARIVEGNDMAHPTNLMDLHLSHKHVSLFDWSSAAECPPSKRRKSSTWPPTEADGMAKRKKSCRS